jgi:transcriptional regulator with XRE-family HTH domain
MTGDEIRARRKAMHIPQPELARRLGVSVNTINRWEHGKAAPMYPDRVEAVLTSLEHSALVDASITISVQDCRAAVSRRVDGPGGSYTYERAANWVELEDDAIVAIQEAGGAVNISGHYRCPVELARRAVWA